MNEVWLDEEPKEFKADIALPGKRIFVALIDVVNCWILSYGISYLFYSLSPQTSYTISLSVMIAYKVLGEKKGWPTFGKYIYKTDVLKKDLTVVNWSNIIRRNIVWMMILLAHVFIHYVLVRLFASDVYFFSKYYLLYQSKYYTTGVILLILIDMGWIFISPLNQAMHDVVGDTIVINKE